MIWRSDKELLNDLLEFLVVKPAAVVVFLLLASGIAWLLEPVVDSVVDFAIYLAFGEWP